MGGFSVFVYVGSEGWWEDRRMRGWGRGWSWGWGWGWDITKERGMGGRRKTDEIPDEADLIL